MKTKIFSKNGAPLPADEGDEIVISGISGVFPKSDDIREFGENLLAKKDLVTETNTKFKAGTDIKLIIYYYNYYYYYYYTYILKLADSATT